MFMWRLFAGELDKKSRCPETQQHAFVPIVIYFASIGSAKSGNTISIGNSTSIICITLPVSQHLRNAHCVLLQPRILWKLWVHVAKFFGQKIWMVPPSTLFAPLLMSNMKPFSNLWYWLVVVGQAEVGGTEQTEVECETTLIVAVVGKNKALENY